MFIRGFLSIYFTFLGLIVYLLQLLSFGLFLFLSSLSYLITMVNLALQ